MKIAILTPIPIEYQKVRELLGISTLHAVQHNGRQYEEGRFQGRFHPFEVIISQTGSKNTEVALATDRAIQQYNPNIVILTGIAGGVKDVKIGDVVIANKLYGYESGKETDEGFVSRPEVFTCSLDLVDHAKQTALSPQWKSRSPFAENSNVFTGPIISGDKVIASIESPVYKNIKKHFNDTIALEMEASGFGKVMLYHPMVKFINIRGVSDLLKNKSETDEEGSQEKAVANAVGFVFEMLDGLDMGTLNQVGIIDSKKVIANAIPQQSKEIMNSTVERINDLIQDDKIKVALELILPLAKIKDVELYDNCILLTNRWNRLMKKQRLDLIAGNEFDRSLNNIIVSLLYYVKQLS